jgi:CheY-like chemotaxis protein
VKPYAAIDLTEKLKNSFPHLSDSPAVNESVINNLRILVVEDNKLNQKALGIMLRVLGYSFDIAEDGYTGYLQAKAKQYDLILMDLMLPEIDGFEATQKILKVDKKVKVVAFTSDNMPETRKKAELSGIIDFITKPVRLDDLQKLFAKHFKK